jgi:MinD superfamily P-loop ATPase
MPRDSRSKRDVHAINEDGMLACNPRDKEAAHRADVSDIATGAIVTCKKCKELMRTKR